MLNKKSFVKRTVIGFFISLFMIGLVVLAIGFQNSDNESFFSGRAINSLLISILIVLAVIEMRRALGKERIPDCFSWIIWAYGIGIAPAYSLFGYTGIVMFTLLLFASATITALTTNRADSLMYIAFVLVYPGLLMASLLYINRCASTQVITEASPLYPYVENDIWSHFGSVRTSQLLPYNALGLALVFAVSSFTDIFAYLFGSLFGKHKFCPEISPNKTVEGAVGGLLGGLIGAFLIFVVFELGYAFDIPSMQFVPEQCALSFQNMKSFNLYLSYLLIGIFGSVMTQIGDLLASLIKRSCGIKDYSHVLGEHGGIMDRFDGIMLNSVFVAIVYMFII